MIEPYVFVRGITLALGLTWSLTALLRVVRLAASWEQRLVPIGLDRRWLRRQLAIACLRATVLDPLNLALLLLLAALWTVPGSR